MDKYILIVIYSFLVLSTLFLPLKKILPTNSNYIFEDKNNLEKNFKWNIGLITILLFIFILINFKDSNQNDDFSRYVMAYNQLKNTSIVPFLLLSKEVGFKYLNIAFAHFDLSYYIFFGTISIFCWGFFIKGSYKFSYLLPLMLYFAVTNGHYFWSLLGVRQSIAIALFFYSIKFIIERKVINYLLIIIIASLFHTSVLILMPIYFFNNINFNRTALFIMYLCSIFLTSNSFLHEQFTSFILNLSKYIDFINTYASSVETTYFKTDLTRVDTGYGVFLRQITTLYIIYKSKTILEKLPHLKIYFLLYIIYAILSNIFFSIDLITRVILYLNICFPIVIAATIYFFNNKLEKIISLILIILYYLMFIKGLL